MHTFAMSDAGNRALSQPNLPDNMGFDTYTQNALRQVYVKLSTTNQGCGGIIKKTAQNPCKKPAAQHVQS